MRALVTQLNISSLDLIIFLIAIVIDALLIILVNRSNPKSATNKIFALLNLSTILWLAITYAVRSPELVSNVLILSRLGIFFAALMSALFFMLAHTFPSDKIMLNRRALFGVSVSTILMMALNISPYAFVGADFSNGVAQLKSGIGLIPFAVFSTLFSILAVFYLFKKLRNSSGEEKKQLKLVWTGMLLMLTLIIATILIPIIFFNSGRFLSFAPLYTLIFFGMTAYAVVKHRLFNAKVFAAEAIVVILLVVLFSNIFVAPSLGEAVVDIFVFIVTVVFGILLIRSVLQEIRSKEKIERLATDLEKANEELKRLDQAKSEFISIASHQLRTPLSIIKGYISMMREGSFGILSDALAKTVNKIYLSNERLIKLVNDLLDLSRMESGKLKYEFLDMDLKDLVSSIVDEFQIPAKDKGIKIMWQEPKEDLPPVSGDAWKLRQVFFNLLDNGLKYTDQGGGIEIKLEKADNFIKLSVHDSGVGMSSETAAAVFHKFARGKEGARVNTAGTGLGLYIAKKIIDDHHGRIWAESEGEGKGSTFNVMLPISANGALANQFAKILEHV
ncbi:hypothetical protein HYS99_01420 [Candidatus Giovannonibacteria bacterium]|nr:hypothetical protein [Candidatus Giovannonibacteria bacterium]